MADMHAAARDLHAALVVAGARAGLATFVYREHPWHGAGGADAVAMVAMDAPEELWPHPDHLVEELAVAAAEAAAAAAARSAAWDRANDRLTAMVGRLGAPGVDVAALEANHVI